VKTVFQNKKFENEKFENKKGDSMSRLSYRKQDSTYEPIKP